MSDLILHGLPPSSYVRTAMMVCEAKGVDYRLEPVDFRSPEYKAEFHPFSRMPAMTHGDLKLYETLAIAVYVDEAFDGPALQPDTPAGRALMLQWISVVNDYLYDSIVGGCVSERFVKPMRGLEPDVERINSYLPAIADGVDVIEAAPAKEAYLTGPALTLADLFFAPVLHYFAATPEGAEMLPKRPNVQKWMTLMAGSAGYEKINKLGP